MPNNIKKAFKRGLIKASMSTGSWIITNGFNTGVSKLVGEAISEYTKSAFVSDLILIGILESETVVFKNKLEHLKPDIKQPFNYFHKDNLTTSGEIYLDSNHTHFIFLNDSVTSSEVKFRPYLEAELRKSKQHLSNLVLSNSFSEYEGKHDIPLIQICVHGDLDTLLIIKQSLKLRIPILILEGSKGCADMIVNAIKQEDSELFFCLDLTVWYLRLLHVSLVFRSLGPKLVMIYKMAKDLIYFMCLTSIFVCAFGITTEASLYPSSKFDLNLIRRILTKGYWPIYGTIKILEDFDKFFSNCTQQSDCPDPHGMVYSYLALIVYMVLANVLLVNLLIAMFSATFQQVHENSDLIWKFQLYTLVNEYVDAPIFPAPFCLIMYPFEIIKVLILKNRAKRIKKATETDEFLQIIQDLEKKSAVEYLEQKEEQKKQSLDEILRWNTEKLELLEQKFNNLSEIRLKR
ncbi:transient receptor potential cation channel trpm isoform X4 [Brachionus plicatilis]|uniref:Transient receptor potential cation channel trpm isoform X4 n=1 Tax=Brachionus plicatilis TaxID=10195 RepID=A0A3M7RGY5_BRAPC|nr:transient receptor potential cation channel trpm isoform X4 [Brachionus plicatilis]